MTWAFVVALLAPESAPALPGVDELLARNLASRGGRERLASVRTMRLTGRMTAEAPVLDDVREAKRLARKPVLVGSGANEENIGAFLQYADGVIVGSSLKKDGVMENPVDPARVRRFMDAVRASREAATRT